MNGTSALTRSDIRLAFWGYTNAHEADAVLALARQLRDCDAVLDGRAEVSRFFYDTPAPISDLMVLAVRGAGGPSHRDGGWEELSAIVPAPDRGFDAIICQSAERVARQITRVLSWEKFVAAHGATILYANEPWLDLTETTARPSDRMWRRCKAALADHDYTTAEAFLAARRAPRGGG